MSVLQVIFNEVLYRPVLNALMLLYQYIPGGDFGVAIIVLTLIVKTLLFPSTLKSIKAQRELQEIQPKIKELQEKHKDDKAAQGKALMELYQKEGINPAAGCLPMLAQLPILIALFLVLRNVSGGDGITQDGLYSFISAPEQISLVFLGVLNLAKASPIIAVLAGILQFFQMKMTIPKTIKSSSKNDFAGIMQKQMLYFFPFFTMLILWRLQSAIGLYWITTTLFSIGQQYIAFKNKKDV